MAEVWRVNLLGEITVQRREAQVVHIQAPRTQALLVLLALVPGQTRTREWLGEQLWPASDPRDQRNRLKQTLVRLRQDLGANFPIETIGKSMLRLSKDIVTDLAEFQREDHWEKALRLYRGCLAPGLFEEAIEHERGRMEVRYQECLEQQKAYRNQAQFQFIVPVPLMPFIGRTSEQELLRKLLTLPQNRLITITGSGGIGKTHLALALAQERSGNTHFVSLAAITQLTMVMPELIESLVATGITQDKSEGLSPLERLCRMLAPVTRLLLVLDNLEPLVSQDIGGLLRTLLERLPQLQLLVTSRQVLGVTGEVCFDLPPLVLGEAKVCFLAQVQAVDPHFLLTEAEEYEVTAICQKLDCVPLALLLAAAWVGTLSLAQLRERLNLALLGEPLRECIAASFRLLPPGLEEFWLSLSVFQGGWTLEAAEAIAKDLDVLRALSALRARSLITITREGESIRYGMLAPLLEFARQEISTSLKNEMLQRGHAFFLEQITVIEKGLYPDRSGRSHRAESLKLFMKELPNLIASCRWGLQQDAPVMLTTLTALRSIGWFFWVRNLLDLDLSLCAEVMAWESRLKELDEAGRASVLRTMATYTHRKIGDLRRAEYFIKESIELYARLGDISVWGQAMERYQWILEAQGRSDEATRVIEEVLAAWQKTENQWETVQAMIRVQHMNYRAGNHKRAIQLYEEARAIFVQLGDQDSLFRLDTDWEIIEHWCAHKQHAHALANLSAAIPYFEDSEQLLILSHCWINRGHVLHQIKEFAEAVKAFGRAQKILQGLGEIEGSKKVDKWMQPSQEALKSSQGI
jgi:tetratricopeptide (TPR) repeat protein